MNLNLEIDLKVFLLTLAIVCVVLMLVVLVCGKENQRRILGFFVEYREPEQPAKQPKKSASSKAQKRARKEKAVQPYVETAILHQKIDERRRVVDTNGHSTLFNEYFELVFETKDGAKIHLVTTRAPFKEVPFNREGTLTYSNGKLITFEYSGRLISDDCSPLMSLKEL